MADSLAKRVASARLQRTLERSPSAAASTESDAAVVDADERSILLPPDGSAGEPARMVFCPPVLRCDERWEDRPVRPPPQAPNSLRTGRLIYYVDTSTLMHPSENLVQVLLREQGYEPAVIAAPGAAGSLAAREQDSIGQRLQRALDECSRPPTCGALFWYPNELELEHGVLPLLAEKLTSYGRVNKLPGASALTTKSLLWRSLERMQQIHGSAAFRFVPTSFVLPDELEVFEQFMHARLDSGDTSDVWILKPDGQSRGTGIYLHRPSEVVGRDGEVVPAAARRHKGVASVYIVRLRCPVPSPSRAPSPLTAVCGVTCPTPMDGPRMACTPLRGCHRTRRT